MAATYATPVELRPASPTKSKGETLFVPRLLIEEARAVTFDMPPEQDERSFLLDWDNAGSETPPAIWNIARFLMAKNLWQGKTPNFAVLGRNARRSLYASDPMHQESGRFIGEAALTSIYGAAQLETFDPDSLETERRSFAPDGSTTTLDADTFRSVTARNSVVRGYNLTIGLVHPDLVAPSPVKFPPELL